MENGGRKAPQLLYKNPLSANNRFTVVTITPIFNKEFFKYSHKCIIKNQNNSDHWIISIDSGSSLNVFDFKDLSSMENISVIKSDKPKGAGNTRNSALHFISTSLLPHLKYPFILHFLDSGDSLFDNAYDHVRSIFSNSEFKLHTFSYNVNTRETIKPLIHSNKLYSYSKFLKNYVTSCLSTFVLVENHDFFQICKFSFRYRANDQLFFLNCAKLYGYLQTHSHVLASYNKFDAKSLSSKKVYLIFYKYLALRDHGLSIFQSLTYTLYHIKKYLKNKTNVQNK